MTVPNLLTWPSTKKSNGTEKFATTGTVNGCSVGLETQFVRTRLCMDTTQVLFVEGSLPLMGITGERPEFDVKPPLETKVQIIPRGDPLKSFPQGDTSERQRVVEIVNSLLLGELTKAIEPHLPVCQQYHGQLCPTKWSSPMTKSIVICSHRPSGGFPRRIPLTRHMWICMHAWARGVDNRSVRAYHV